MKKSSVSYSKPTDARDLREQGRIILAHGEVTGHCHEVLAAARESAADVCYQARDGETAARESAADVCYQARDGETTEIPTHEYFEEPGTGRRILMIAGPHVLRHEEHGAITLDPAAPAQVRQGDVLLNPIANGVYHVIRQSEYDPSEVRQVLD